MSPVHRPSGAELAARCRASRHGYVTGPDAPPPDPLTTGTHRTRSLTVTFPDPIASRVISRASLLGVSPSGLVRALLRHYADHPELYGCTVDAQHRPTLHSQGVLFDQLSEGSR